MNFMALILCIKKMSDLYLEFFKSHAIEESSNDCSIQMGDVLVVLAYPIVIIIGPPPWFHDSVIDVKNDDLTIELGKYPIVKFLTQNPDVCTRIVEEHQGLKNLFNEWEKKNRKFPSCLKPKNNNKMQSTN